MARMEVVVRDAAKPMRASELVVIGMAASGVLLAIVLALLLTLVDYHPVFMHLASVYGEEITSRHFSVAAYHSAQAYLRLGSLSLLLVAFALGIQKRRVSRIGESLAQSIALGWRHAWRARRLPCPSVTIPLGLITIIGIAVRISFLDRVMRYDEGITLLRFASAPLYFALSLYPAPNNHLFHTFLVYLSTHIFGDAEWAVRLPALASGAALAPLTYLLTRHFAGQGAGLLAAALVSTSSILIEYSVNARGYTMICALTLVLAACAAEIRRRASPFWFMVFGITAALGLWTIPIFLFPLGGVTAWLLWESAGRSLRTRRFVRNRLTATLALSGLGALLLYLPVIVVNGPMALVSNPYVSGKTWSSFVAGNRSEMMAIWETWSRDMEWVFVLILCVWTVGLFSNRGIRRLVVTMLAWSLAVTVACQFVPFARTWLFLLPIFLIGASIGTAWIASRTLFPALRRPVMSSTFAVLLCFTLALTQHTKESIRESTETGVLLGVRDIVAFLRDRNISAEDVFRHYVSGIPLEYYSQRNNGNTRSHAAFATLAPEDRRELWLLTNWAVDESLASSAEKLGIVRYQILERVNFSGATLYRLLVID